MGETSILTNKGYGFNHIIRLISGLSILIVGIEFITGFNNLTIWVSLSYIVMITLGLMVILSSGKQMGIFFINSFSILLYLNGFYEFFNTILRSQTTFNDMMRVASLFALGSGLLLASRSLTLELRDKYETIWGDSDANSYAVELINVVKDYFLGPIVVHALRGVNLKVRKGEFIAIMGPSGSGKSTLLNLIGALDRPTEGKVLIDGVDISKLNDDQLAYLRNKKIGFIFQAYNLINRTNVLRNVEMPAIVSGLSKRERIEKAKMLLEAVGLKEEAYRQPKYLSGGQQQRVAIARALMNNPTIILADEPTGNLDSKTGAEVMNYLKKMNEEFGTTIIVVTHDREVAEYADRIVHLKDGKIVNEEILKKR